MAHIFALLLALQQAATTTPVLTLDARWVTTFEEPPAATPGFDSAGAYVPLKSGELVAVDLDRGTIRWKLGTATSFTPATGDGLVFLATEDGIEARQAITGDLAWRTALPGGVAAPLYWDTGWLIASTSSGDLAAFRAADGALMWRKQLGSALTGPPGPALDRLFLPLADKRLVAVELATGDTIWERTFTAAITSLLALDDQLVVGTASKHVSSHDLRRGNQRWIWRLGGDLAGIPAADDKRIYLASRDNMLRAVDRKSGNMRWHEGLSSRPAGGPLRFADAVLMPLVSNQIVGFDPGTGEQTVSAAAAGEIGLQPYVRAGVRQTLPQLITVSRDGQLQGFGRRFEPAPVPLSELPGSPAIP